MQSAQLATSYPESQTFIPSLVTKENRVSWSEYNKKIVNFFLKSLRDQGKPDYIVSVGPESIIFGNTLSRLFGRPVGYSLTTPNGDIAKNVSIVIPSKNNTDFQENGLKGKGLLVDVASKVRLSKAKDEILNRNSDISLDTGILFEATNENEELILPDEIFKRVDLSGFTQSDLKDFSDEDLTNIAANMYEQVKNDTNKKLTIFNTAFEDLLEPVQHNNDNEFSKVRSITWDDYGRMIINLGLKIIRNNTNVDFILGIGRGGAPIGKFLSEILKKPLALSITSSYKGTGECEKSKLLMAQHITIGDESELQGDGIVIDDLVESGGTLDEFTKKALKDAIKSLITGVLIQKSKTVFFPNFYIEKDDRWLVLPDELAEALNTINLEQNHLKGMTDDKIYQFTNDLFANLPKDPSKKIDVNLVKELVLKHAALTF